jgi:hypothetical protein
MDQFQHVMLDFADLKASEETPSYDFQITCALPPVAETTKTPSGKSAVRSKVR